MWRAYACRFDVRHRPWRSAGNRLTRAGVVRVSPAALLSSALRDEYRSVSSTLWSIWRREGLRGFFRGYSAAALIIPVHWMCYFPLYESIKPPLILRSQATDHAPDSTSAMLRHSAACGTAAVAASVITDTLTNPLWVVRTRLVTQHAHIAMGSTQAVLGGGPLQVLRTILRTEGLRALYRGLGVSWVASAHVFIQFPVYELLRARLTTADTPLQLASAAPRVAAMRSSSGLTMDEGDSLDALGLTPPIPPTSLGPAAAASAASASAPIGAVLGPTWPSVIAAASISKIVASVLTYPIDVIRCLLQDAHTPRPARVGQSGAGLLASPGFIATARRVVQTEGVAGLYAGFVSNLLRVLPACSITFVAYETLAQSMARMGW